MPCSSSFEIQNSTWQNSASAYALITCKWIDFICLRPNSVLERYSLRSPVLPIKSIWGKIAGSGFINAIKKPKNQKNTKKTPKTKPCKSLVQICICSCVCIYTSPVTLFWWIMGTVIWMLGQITWIPYSFLLCQFLHYIMSKMPQYRRVTAL